MSMPAPRLFSAASLCLAALALASCGNSGKGLIPAQNAGPLQADFEAIAQAAQAGNGNCTATASAIRRTEQDLAALPRTVDRGLQRTIEGGMSNLRSRALTLCAQPSPSAESTTTLSTSTTSSTPTTTTTSTSTSTTTTETTSTLTSPTETPTATTPSGPGGGTQAPGAQGNGTPGAGGATPPSGNGQQSPGGGNGENGAGQGGNGQ